LRPKPVSGPIREKNNFFGHCQTSKTLAITSELVKALAAFDKYSGTASGAEFGAARIFAYAKAAKSTLAQAKDC
jgi:hypothetical protein